MIENLKEYLKNTVVLINVIVSFLCIAALFILIFLKIRPTSQPIPLHYNVYVGINYIGPWYYLYGIPVIASIIVLINQILGLIFFHRKKFLSYFLGVASSLVSLYF